MSHIIDSEPSSYEEASSQPIWRDVVMEEYQSIMKNDVWDIVLRPDGKSVVTSKWIYKIKHIHFYLDDYFPCSIHGLETTSDGYEDSLYQWRD
jgi:hypothetical protein